MEKVKFLILFGLLGILLLLLCYELFFSPAAGMRMHLQKMAALRAQVKHYRAVRSGRLPAITRQEKYLTELSEYDFEKTLFNLVNSYEKGYLVARRMWSDYQIKLEARALNLRYATGSPTEQGGRVVYFDPQAVKAPTLIGEAPKEAKTIILHQAKTKKSAY